MEVRIIRRVGHVRGKVRRVGNRGEGDIVKKPHMKWFQGGFVYIKGDG